MDEPMARELNASALLRNAARLVERALIQLNTTEVRCQCCNDRLFENIDHAKVYEQFTDLSVKLRAAADRVSNPNPARSRGYEEARRARRASLGQGG